LLGQRIFPYLKAREKKKQKRKTLAAVKATASQPEKAKILAPLRLRENCHFPQKGDFFSSSKSSSRPAGSS
jgi:hypothetical protein